MKIILEMPVCRQRRAKEGFYLLVNGKRLHFKRRGDAIASAQSLLDMQRLQVVTVRQFAARAPKHLFRTASSP
jgi:hypothetical protein